MTMIPPEGYEKYAKWFEAKGKDPEFTLSLKPGAPKEAKIIYEKIKKMYTDARKKGLYI
jgi:hypothetical protein